MLKHLSDILSQPTTHGVVLISPAKMDRNLTQIDVTSRKQEKRS